MDVHIHRSISDSVSIKILGLADPSIPENLSCTAASAIVLGLRVAKILQQGFGWSFYPGKFKFTAASAIVLALRVAMFGLADPSVPEC
jgi:hypothetical protein